MTMLSLSLSLSLKLLKSDVVIMSGAAFIFKFIGSLYHVLFQRVFALSAQNVIFTSFGSRLRHYMSAVLNRNLNKNHILVGVVDDVQKKKRRVSHSFSMFVHRFIRSRLTKN
uniref:Uncharacterized protein n=1 Tax=Octopus bimaculoides TaxID=37653 RepID=A0A0L8IDQ7_OCTBM